MPTSPARVVPSLSWDNCRLLVETVVDYAIFMLDAEGRVATWNRGAEKILGYASGEIVGQHFACFFTAEDVAAGKPDRGLRNAEASGRVEDEDWRVRKDGSRFWANIVTTALFDQGGQLRGYGKVTRDLTERVEVVQQLRQSEERFHHLVDAVTDYAIYMLDVDGNVATWNVGAERIKGYAPQEIIGRHFSAFYTPEARAAGKPAMVLDTVRREGRFEEEDFRVRKDGTRFWASVTVTALRNESGELAGFAKVTRDLSERRRREQELIKAEERFRLLVDGVTDYAIYMLDAQGSVSTWNAGAQRLKGYSAQEIMGRHFSVFFPWEDAQRGKPERELETAREYGRFEEEGWRVRKDGSRFWANVVITAIRDVAGELRGFAKVTRDLTERRDAAEIERRLLLAQAARESAESANRMKDEFLATVSHELRTPLNAIVGWASMLRIQQADPFLTKGVDVIYRNAHAQLKIIEDILDVSRIVTGKLKLEPKVVDAVVIVREAIDVVRPSASAKRLSIDLDAPKPCLVSADAERLQQVVWNLLSNAVKFSETNGSISVSVQPGEASDVVISVSDNGRGIDAEFLPFVFERFRQADTSAARSTGGLGLGLALVRHIVELHGGAVSADSRGRGFGATFTVRLPNLEQSSNAQLQTRGRGATRRPSHADSLRGVRILLVEDDNDARELLTTVLIGAGAFVATAASAAEAFELVRSFEPQVLLSDIGLPAEDGYSFMRRVRSLDPASGGAVPAIALTAFTRADDRARALAAGFTSHLPKPVDLQLLVRLVAELTAAPEEERT